MSLFLIGSGNEQCRDCENLDFNSQGAYCMVLYPEIEDGVCMNCAKTTEE